MQCLEIVEDINNRWSLIYGLNNLRLAQVHLGELAAGQESLLKALRIAREEMARPVYDRLSMNASVVATRDSCLNADSSQLGIVVEELPSNR